MPLDFTGSAEFFRRNERSPKMSANIIPNRKYSRVWWEIKKKGSVRLQLKNSAAFKTIKKAIITEKYKDSGFKLVNEGIDSAKLKIEFDPKTLIVTFELVQVIGIEDMIRNV